MNAFVIGGGGVTNPVQVTHCKAGSIKLLDITLLSCVMKEGIRRHYRRPQLNGSSSEGLVKSDACIMCLLSFVAGLVVVVKRAAVAAQLA